jgi:hypothetical protein
MKKKRNHVTRKMVNDALRVGGRNESLREGEGYFYFGGGEAVNWLSRFPKTREVGCFLGLRPGRRDSAKSQSQMRISKEGDYILATYQARSITSGLRYPSKNRGWVSISPLQQENPCGVGQWIGGHLEIDVATAQVRCENRHDAIQSQIVSI